MLKSFIAGVRILAILLVAHALMLLGADEISTLEAGGIRTIRPLDTILTLYGADVKTSVTQWPEPLSWAAGSILALPGWAVLAGLGFSLVLLSRSRE